LYIRSLADLSLRSLCASLRSPATDLHHPCRYDFIKLDQLSNLDIPKSELAKLRRSPAKAQAVRHRYKWTAKHISKKKRDAILAKEGFEVLDSAYVAAGLIYDIGAFFPHDVGHAVGAELVKKSIHLFVMHILGTTGRKNLDRRMKPPNFRL
jgi:hypothetical protein